MTDEKQRCRVIRKDGYVLTDFRTETRRGVVWLGQTCNLKCYFCYFTDRIRDSRHPEKPFMSLEKASAFCRVLRDEYGLTAIDIQGGEPTIYPQIIDLIGYCNDIGLKPTLITNALALADREYCSRFSSARVFDCLVSIQALADDYDRIVQVPGAFERQLRGIENLRDAGIPIRINTVLTQESLGVLDQIAEMAVRYEARVVNFLGYNNSGDQKKVREKERVPYYHYIAAKIEPVIDYLESRDIEVNVRFVPLCVVGERFRKNMQNDKQKFFDTHEWEILSRFWIERPGQRQAALPLTELPNIRTEMLKLRLRMRKARALVDFFSPRAMATAPAKGYQRKIEEMLSCYEPLWRGEIPIEGFNKVDYFYLDVIDVFNDRVRTSKCRQCDLQSICDGLHSDYVSMFSDEAITPVRSLGRRIYDPRFYVKEQLKVVEEQEYDWALPEGFP